MSAIAQGHSSLRRRLSVLRRATEYELRKVSMFRVGFLVREVFVGVVPPLSMIAMYWALYRGDMQLELRGWSLPALIRYLIGVAVFSKLVTHGRLLDVAEQIFEGYFTKYLVMPFPFMLLPLARWLQHTLLQLAVVTVMWVVGAVCLPEYWPMAADVWAIPQALVLTLLGSLCFLEMFLIINLLAFWLDVIWSLLVMMIFVTNFIGGRIVPVSQMPESAFRILEWGFPYWAIAAPVQRFLGHLDGGDVLRGVLVLGVSLLLLDGLRRVVWTRGRARYAGSGM